MKSTSIFLLIAFSFFAIACGRKKTAELIVHHAKIYTVNEGFETAEAMAVKDGKILAVGTDKEIESGYSAKEVVDARGKFIYPGFIDAHCHFTGFATDMWKCDLTGTESFDQIISKIKEYSAHAPMEWIYGRGWDQNDWAVKQFPDNIELDKLFPNRPVFLKRIDGHAALANSVALKLADITLNTQINGGTIEKKNGKLTGILVDNAMDIVEAKIPPISDQLAKEYYEKAQSMCFELGLTGVHDCGVSEHTIDLIEEAHHSGKLKMKIFALLSDNPAYYKKWISKGPYKTDRLHVGGFKVYADGALGSRGASLLKDYSDQPGWKGFLLSKPAHFDSLAKALYASALQMCTHAIGDSGNRQILKTYASVLKGANDRRWRIEHAQVVNEADFHYFKDFNIIPSVQPTHATSDMYWAESRLGHDRMKGAYAYQSLLKTNNWMPLGTDFPVEYISPFKTFFAAVARQDAKGYPANGFQMDEALTREEALRGMTIWAAKSAFEENEKGSLEPGKTADFIMLDIDLLKEDKGKLLNTKVLGTWVNGEKVF